MGLLLLVPVLHGCGEKENARRFYQKDVEDLMGIEKKLSKLDVDAMTGPFDYDHLTSGSTDEQINTAYLYALYKCYTQRGDGIIYRHILFSEELAEELRKDTPPAPAFYACMIRYLQELAIPGVTELLAKTRHVEDFYGDAFHPFVVRWNELLTQYLAQARKTLERLEADLALAEQQPRLPAYVSPIDMEWLFSPSPYTKGFQESFKNISSPYFREIIDPSVILPGYTAAFLDETRKLLEDNKARFQRLIAQQAAQEDRLLCKQRCELQELFYVASNRRYLFYMEYFSLLHWLIQQYSEDGPADIAIAAFYYPFWQLSEGHFGGETRYIKQVLFPLEEKNGTVPLPAGIRDLLKEEYIRIWQHGDMQYTLGARLRKVVPREAWLKD